MDYHYNLNRDLIEISVYIISQLRSFFVIYEVYLDRIPFNSLKNRKENVNKINIRFTQYIEFIPYLPKTLLSVKMYVL